MPGADGPAKQRRKLSQVGVVVALAIIDDRLELAEDIEIILDGVPTGMDEELAIAAEKAFESMAKNRRKDDGIVAETIRTAIRRTADMAWGKKPIVKVLVVRV